jgi:hypothetical protein
VAGGGDASPEAEARDEGHRQLGVNRLSIRTRTDRTRKAADLYWCPASGREAGAVACRARRAAPPLPAIGRHGAPAFGPRSGGAR